MTFQQKLDTIIKKNNSLLSIGFDPVMEKIPSFLKKEEYPFFKFNKTIIDTTHDMVCAYKFNSAFYEAEGDRGLRELKMTCDYIRQNYTQIPIILDAKRADIGNTNNGYISYAFSYIGADAITLNPFPGKEGLKPFLEQKDKGCIIWCKSSNPGSEEFQNLLVDNEPLYKIIAQKVTNEWNIFGNCMLVMGATYPEELAEIRKIVGDMTLLVPGIGAQGGNVEKTIKAGLNSQKAGMIINSSRGIIFAGSGEDFAQKARIEAIKLNNEINKYRK